MIIGLYLYTLCIYIKLFEMRVRYIRSQKIIAFENKLNNIPVPNIWGFVLCGLCEKFTRPRRDKK